MKPKIISFIPAIIWFIITFMLLIMPGEDIPASSFFDLVYFDKWVHIGMFGLLNLLICYPLLKSSYTRLTLMFSFISAAVILYGFAMEYVQKYFAEGRSFDMYDVLADAAGVIIVFLWLLNKQKKNRLAKEI